MKGLEGSSTWVDFPPHILREYALLADGRRGALCGPRGDLVWLCAPRWDSPVVLSTLIGGEGIFAITPAEPSVWGGYYEPGSLIWRNRWTTSRTRVECREALAFPGHEHQTIILRRIEALEYDVTVRLVLALRADFGAQPMHALHRDDAGAWTARTGNLWARLTGTPGGHVESGRLVAEINVSAGHHHDVMLEVSDRPLGPARSAQHLWAQTEQAWQETPRVDHAIARSDARQANQVWTKHADGDMQAVIAHDGVVYCGGHFSGTGSFDGQDRRKIAAVSASAPYQTLPYAPRVNSALGVWAFAADSSRLFVGGDFTKYGSSSVAHYAVLDG